MIRYPENYAPRPDLLAERVLLITGAGDGIGRAVAVAAAAHGATVILLGRTLRKLEMVYDTIEQAGGPQPAIYPLNLEGASPHDYLDMVSKLEEAFGVLDGIVHNAAELRSLSRIDDYDIDHWYRVMQVNLNAPFLITQACLPLLRKSTAASVLFSADRVGRQGRAYWGAYGVSKFGLEGLMQILADENEGSGIRFNSLDPGPVRTALRAAVYPGEDSATLPAPEEIVAPYLWLLGSDSRGITGQALGG